MQPKPRTEIGEDPPIKVKPNLTGLARRYTPSAVFIAVFIIAALYLADVLDIGNAIVLLACCLLLLVCAQMLHIIGRMPAVVIQTLSEVRTVHILVNSQHDELVERLDRSEEHVKRLTAALTDEGTPVPDRPGESEGSNAR